MAKTELLRAGVMVRQYTGVIDIWIGHFVCSAKTIEEARIKMLPHAPIMLAFYHDIGGQKFTWEIIG